MIIAEQKQIELEKLDLWLTRRSPVQLALLGVLLGVPQGVAALLIPAILYVTAYALIHVIRLLS